MKLYPPVVEPSIPAHYIDTDPIAGLTLTIPFQMNRAVSWADLGQERRMALILKTVSTNKVLLDGIEGNALTFMAKYQTPVASFSIDFQDFTPLTGQYYKVQIAYIDDEGVVGYYSDVSVIKFTDKPDVTIENLNGDTNVAQYSYTGIYKNLDMSEKVYSYEFNIFDTETGILHDTSGIQIHNSNTDTVRTESFDTWTSYKTLENERQYYITYTVKTVNGMEITSPSYPIMAMDTLNIVSKNTEFVATMMFEDGYVHIHILPKDAKADIKAITGNFILVRASSEDNFSTWHEIYRFTLVNNYPLMTLWKDFTVQQGYSYKYAVQAYNSKGIYSNRLECKYYSDELSETQDEINRQNWNSQNNTSYSDWHYLTDGNGLPVDFEDAFLYDGKRQLKIRYNPKVSSFKSTVLESKVDTIGGKYPFIFRNGNVEYKEFPISGLVTMLSDDNGLFLKEYEEPTLLRNYSLNGSYQPGIGYNIMPQGYRGEEQYLYDTQRERELIVPQGSRTALTAENFRKEREFKMEVLKWLTNGEPKLFRSPGEGNFIVRLMNSSLTPNDTLGRMLHTFQCTAYEIADCSFGQLQKYGFINAFETSYQELKFRMLNSYNTFHSMHEKVIVLDSGGYYFAVIDQYGYWALKITYANGNSDTFNCGNSTGQFALDREALKNNPIISIQSVEGEPDLDAKILYGYYEETDIAFSLINEITRETVISQIIGHPDFVDTNGQYRESSFDTNYIIAITSGIDNAFKGTFGEDFDDIPRLVVGKFYYLKAEPRAITNIYLSSGKYYVNKALLDEITTWDDSAIYRVYTKHGNDWRFVDQYSGRPSNGILLSDPSYLLGFNAEENNGQSPGREQLVDLSLRGGSGGAAPVTTGRFEIYFDLDKVTSIRVGSGVVCEICYNLSTVLYECETNPAAYTTLAAQKTIWQNAKNAYNNHLLAGNSQFSGSSEVLRRDMENKYIAYLNQLRETIKEIQEKEETYYAL